MSLVSAEMQAQGKFDPANPVFTELPSAELPDWQKKTLEDWRTAFGGDASNWNPLQMEFYKQVRISALNDSDRQAYIAKTDDDWQKEFGSMDSWQTEQMLFYSAVQDLKME